MIPMRLALLACTVMGSPLLFGQIPASPVAQPRVQAPTNPTEQVRRWYHRFLNREMDRGATRWINDLQRGTAQDQVLAQILASEEYYKLSGSTPEGFVRQLFDDLRAREPKREELRDWTRRLSTMERAAVALVLIREASQPQKPTDPSDSDYFGELRAAIRGVASKLDDLADDIQEELDGKLQRELQRKAESVIDDLRSFERVARPGIARDRMERAFKQFDRNLDELLDAIRRQAPDKRVLLRSVERTAQADQRLHLAFFDRQQPPDRPNPSLLREAEALLVQGKQLRHSVATALPDVAAGTRIRKNLDQFLDRAERFRRNVKDGAAIASLRRDFQTLVEPWSAAVQDINTLPPAGGYYVLRVQSQRVEEIGIWLQRQLQTKVDVPFVSMPTPPRK